MTLLYDGSWPGFLSALFEAHLLKPPPEAIRAAMPAQSGLFDEFTQVETDDAKAVRLLRGVREKLSPSAARNLEALYRCGDDETAPMRAFRYLKLGWQWRMDLDNHLEHPDVMAVTLISRRVFGEAHIMLGLTRFASTEQGVYYAAVRTDHDILDIIAEHFAGRLRDMRWAIHDVPRGRAALFDGNALAYADVSSAQPERDEMEAFFSTLWRTYHKTIAIKERVNPRLQAKNMPRRYWEHLLEMQPETTAARLTGGK